MEHKKNRFYRGPVGELLEPVVGVLRGHGLAHRFRLVWKMHRAVWLITRSNRLQIDGHDLLLDSTDSMALSKGWYEPQETAWYDANVRAGDFVVEVGANIGYFTLRLARLVGPQGQVLCFEPDPETSRILARNVSVNGYDNVTVRPVAVAAEPGEMTFYRALRNTGDHRLFSHGKDAGTFPVPTVTLDDEVAGEKRRIDLLKLDIQGAEPLAFDGFRKTLAERPPRRIIMEFWPHGIHGMDRDPWTLLESLRNLGYSVRQLGEPGEFDVAWASRELTVENEKWVNLLLVHEGDLDD